MDEKSPMVFQPTMFVPPQPIPYPPNYTQYVTGPAQGAYGIPVVASTMWKSGIFECFQSTPNGSSLMALFCPCVAVAQIASRLGAFGGYCGVLAVLFVIYCTHHAFAGLAQNEVDNYEQDQGHWTPQNINRLITYATLSSLTALLPALFLAVLRTRVRRVHHIQGSECEDFLCSYFCNCCTIAQMATEVQAYTPGECSFGPRSTIPAYHVVYGNTLV
ncbi:hypothetical protein B5M09_005609 [Aphanomyces astaci]|uniref:Uncharacterized protein n=1 Tax=Aphanomyces astaci TaxID=112090 RepID=A0A425D9U7_APHAT|nr:hypothetical protein B5M09_005609 [Aphanomyces astaci]